MDNRIKTFLLLLVLTAIVLAIGSIFGRTGLIIAFIIVLAMNLFSYYFSDKIVLFLYRAKPLPRQHWLYHETEKLAKKAGIPVPKLYVSEFPVANAFATGRNPKHSAVVVTRKIMDMLSREELVGVISHELSHVKNRDILIATIASVLAGVVMYLAAMIRWNIMMGSFEGENRGNILGLIALLLIAIIAPLAALLIQLAISRSREYLADESGARLIGNGKPLANALLKLERQTKIPSSKALGFEATENLFIVSPFSASGLVKLFSTHPPVEERVRRLLRIK
ncbi:MAG: M48 family metalloprotease [Candidatus Pacearchaeota archaeon]